MNSLTEFTQKMDGDLSEGGMQTVALGDGAPSGEGHQSAPSDTALPWPGPNSAVPAQSAPPPSQPIPAPQARPTSLPQYPHNPGSAYTSPNSANSPGRLGSRLATLLFVFCLIDLCYCVTKLHPLFYKISSVDLVCWYSQR